MAQPLVDTPHAVNARAAASGSTVRASAASASAAGAGADARAGVRRGAAQRWLDELVADAPRFDFFQAMRILDCAHPTLPRLGEARRPADEPVRIGQPASLAFAASAITRFVPAAAPEGGGPGASANGPARLSINCFGMLGPNGALPLHLTEYARQRELHERDHTFARFLDVFHHRIACLFYRAWAVHQQTVSHDRPADDDFARYLGSLIGTGMGALADADAVPDTAKIHYAGHLAHRQKNAGGLAGIVADYFGVPARVEEFVAHALPIDRDERAQLGRNRASTTVGQGLVLGARVTDVQFNFRLHIGPLDWAAYRSLLPGGAAIRQLRDWVRNYCNLELRYDVRLTLRADAVRPAALGRPDRPGLLGWSTWLTTRPPTRDRDDLTLDVERYA